MEPVSDNAGPDHVDGTQYDNNNNYYNNFADYENDSNNNNNSRLSNILNAFKDLGLDLMRVGSRSDMMYSLLNLDKSATKEEIIHSYQVHAQANRDNPEALYNLNAIMEILTNDRLRYELDQETPVSVLRGALATAGQWSSTFIQHSLRIASVLCQTSTAILSPKAQMQLWVQLWREKIMFRDYLRTFGAICVRAWVIDTYPVNSSLIDTIKRSALAALVSAPLNMVLTARINHLGLGFFSAFKMLDFKTLLTSLAAQFVFELVISAVSPAMEALQDYTFTFKDAKGPKKLVYYLGHPICVSLLYAAAVTPFATLLHQREMQAFVPAAQRLGLVQLAKNNWQQAGVRAFYRGAVPLTMFALIQCTYASSLVLSFQCP
ncbi:hypothetical protein SAMD00019534_062810 [Acytostelium subglobosum LB1]|uniref:hypothetical protein n=1 Tax=Acytostelium subglobosum LB1 TaxID=1410327 RepID=UPI000644D22A|nr:hypothetical protein SAMD00019534_062810 [Acytostelium subglobosum LB1]GAM23106.1 hypothetical protein SAMD00019534_062810 [Acytostelium subglobosum LB1]|eukprot:XP_012754333.1 hypothetical protein SAMD00019534_062810 [Acytostelium subglobosum LB1]